MTYQMHALTCQPESLNGLSAELILSHHQNNYAGAVSRVNAIRTQLDRLDFASISAATLAALKREELISTNSMLLHELYFASLGGDGKLPPPMALALASNFGTVQRWRDEFVAMGKALDGGSGWVIMSYLARDGILINQWAADHVEGIAVGVPILALDMYRHAYRMDFGANAGAYVERFTDTINWPAVALRYASAVHAASGEFGVTAEETGGALLIDVRRAGIYADAQTCLPGAQYYDPTKINQWMTQLPRDREIVVYCVHGLEVGRNSAIRLRAHGLNARFLEGGIEEWAAAGHPLASKEK